MNCFDRRYFRSRGNIPAPYSFSHLQGNFPCQSLNYVIVSKLSGESPLPCDNMAAWGEWIQPQFQNVALFGQAAQTATRKTFELSEVALERNLWPPLLDAPFSYYRVPTELWALCGGLERWAKTWSVWSMYVHTCGTRTEPCTCACTCMCVREGEGAFACVCKVYCLWAVVNQCINGAIMYAGAYAQTAAAVRITAGGLHACLECSVHTYQYGSVRSPP